MSGTISEDVCVSITIPQSDTGKKRGDNVEHTLAMASHNHSYGGAQWVPTAIGGIGMRGRRTK